MGPMPTASLVLQELDRFGPQRCEALDFERASAYTRRLTEQQYENFSVVSSLLPRRLRDDFRHVYAFCRWADDLGDETGDPVRSRELLDWWRGELDLCYANKPRHPVFVALRATVEKHDLPRKPFDDLIDAFVQDQSVTRYATWEQVVDYCSRSADPVGRLVLMMTGHRDEQRAQLSDATCTALQLINFWQDVRRDVLERDRVYIPRDVAERHGLSLDQMVDVIHGRGDAASVLPAYRATVKELAGRTRELFERGRGLWPLLSPDIRPTIKLFSMGGVAVLRSVERRGYDTLTARPSLSKRAKAGLVMRAGLAKLLRVGR